MAWIDTVFNFVLAAEIILGGGMQAVGGGSEAGLEVGGIDCEAIRLAQFPDVPPALFQPTGDGCGPVMPVRPVDDLPSVEPIDSVVEPEPR